MNNAGGELLEITSTDEGLALIGEIDGHSSPGLAMALADLADRHITLDMAGVDFVDSSGLRVLIEAHQSAEQADGSLTLVSVSAPVARLLELSGVLGYLRVKPDAIGD